ncbi:MAG: glutaminyl-peptide cyclotransferase [Acidobacteriota bacterium]|nr:glutaminyl-peptide cyclotransferase [Acidobacteriota bacterium]
MREAISGGGNSRSPSINDRVGSGPLDYLETQRDVKLACPFSSLRKMIFKTRPINLFTLVPNKGNIVLGGVLVLLLSLSTLGCRTGSVANLAPERVADNKHNPSYGYQVVHTWPHDPNAFTQGLVFHDGKLLESTGQEGRSSLRLVELETGTVLKKVDVPSPYFAEGITLLNGKIYQLTWLNHRGFIYDASTFTKLGEFSLTGEGWGLANDGQSLILSDGTNQLRFLTPDNFEVRRTIAVGDGSSPVTEINELEYVQGEIYANIWHSDKIARINAHTGMIVGWIDLTGLLAPGEVHDEEAVLNGIAYDEMNGRLFVTGKLWPKLFEIKVIQK